MAAETIVIGGRPVRPGERQTIDLPLAKLYTHTNLAMPVHVVNGRRPGPVLFVSAAIHGDEINGVEIIRRLLKLPAIPRIHGALIAIPVVNVYGFLERSRYLPDRRDLNRSFPGSNGGSLAARVAHIFMQEIVQQSTHGIDLHTGALHRFNLPQIRAQLDNAETRRLAEAFGTPVIINSTLRDFSLREAAVEQGMPMLVYEAGEALRFDELSIRAGVRGIVNVMRALGMLPQSRRRRPYQPVVARASNWIRAAESGILRALVGPGTAVKKNEIIGFISDPFGEGEIAVSAPSDGLVVGRTNLPLVHEGEALFHLARFREVDSALECVDEFQETFHNEASSEPFPGGPIV